MSEKSIMLTIASYMRPLVSYIQPSNKFRGLNILTMILLLFAAVMFITCGVIWGVLRILSQGQPMIFGWLSLGSLFVCILVLIPVIIALIMANIGKSELREWPNEYAYEIRISNWAGLGLLETLAFTIALGSFGIVFSASSFQSVDVVIGVLPEIGLLFLLVFLLNFGGHFIGHMISALPLVQRASVEGPAQRETNLLYPCLYIGGSAGFVYSIITSGVSVSPLRTVILGTLIAGSIVSVASLVFWLIRIWSSTRDYSLNIAGALNETEVRRAYLLNSTHNTMVLIGFLFALLSWYTNSFSVTYSMLLVAAVIMVIFNQFPYAVGEHNLRQALTYRVREELIKLETEIRSLEKQGTTQKELGSAIEKIEELRKKREQIEKDHPLFVNYSLLAAGPLGWLISELIKQIASGKTP